MPVFHTKTIEQILEPVAEQVSHLVILHEQGEDGAAIPSLMKPIQAVSAAVNNLAKVGTAQIQTSKDEVLKLDTPEAINKVKSSADLLLDSAKLIEEDEYSKQGREKLIAGSRGILQGTSDLLLIFDEAEVRRICHVCRRVRDYLKVSEVVAGMEDLVTYVKNLTPGMTNLSDLVLQRSKDLTNALHADQLKTGVADLRNQLPNLISSMKIFVTTVDGSGVGSEASVHNRQYYVKNLSDIITEIIRVLQLVSTDQEILVDPTNVLQLKQVRDKMANNLIAANRWLNDPNAPPDTADELALRQTLDQAREIGSKAGGALGAKIMDKCNDIGIMTEKLAALRKQNKGNSAEARRLANQIQTALNGLLQDVDDALKNLEEIDEAFGVVSSKTPSAKEWLADPQAKPGPGTGSQDIRDIIGATRKIAKSLATNPQTAKDAAELMKMCDELDELMEKLDAYRERGEGHLPEARHLAKQAADKIGQINAKIGKALASGGLPQTLEAKLDVANRWLDHPGVEDGGKGMLAARSVMSDARKLAVECDNPVIKAALLQNAAECESLCNQLADLVKQGKGGSPEARRIAEELQQKLQELKQNMKLAVIGQVADEFSDTTTVLKQFVTAASAPKDVAGREEKFAERSQALTKQAQKLANLGIQAVATSELGAEEKVAKATLSAKKIQELTPQVINAGKIVLDYPENKLAKEHLKALTDEWTEHVDDLTEQVDDAMDVVDFIKASEDGIKKDHKTCMKALQDNQPTVALPAAGNIARRAHRILMAGKREVENTDDAAYVQELKGNLNNLSRTINPMVQATREYANNPNSNAAKDNVRECDDQLIAAVAQVRNTVEARRIEQQAKNIVIEEEPPPVPPLPQDCEAAPPVPPLPEEEEFPEEQEEDVPMMQAARELHEEARKWESKGNDIIATAKRMALLMAKMSHLVRGEEGRKSDLIACAKEIAKASNEVTRLANEVADKCSDRRIRTDMKKTLDRIPTISTQLRILSTVKAASLGDNMDMTKEEEEAAEQATEMLVHNAQNLMMSVKDTVRSAEAASIRIRTEAGVMMRWVRKS
uniref:Vinculin n=1 Tax=Ciona intestinalis TaxID=7719 RepID=H2Y2G2_CIOIN|nr:vinculin [Ciona intestinalis]|eukprot:XP_002123754.1 vinculin [Ciona intestinalis]